MMTKKDFIALADAIREHNRQYKGANPSKFSVMQLDTIANFCKAQNPNFDRVRWLDYIKDE